MPQQTTQPAPQESFDPRDWNELRRVGHAMVDAVVDHLETVRERPVWQPVPEDVRARLREPLPREGQGPSATFADFRRDVLPYGWGNIHPRFWGWVNGSGVPIGVFADFLASAMNPNVGAFEQAATYVEEQVLDWLKTMLDFPAETGGVLASGCSMANLIALGAMRSKQAPFDVRRHGMTAAPRQMTLYASEETHGSVVKAVEALGFGSEMLRRIPVGADYRVDVAALERAIHDDRAAGLQPVAIIGNAGTVNTGAIDDLDALADLAERERLWLHVDGAFGALAWLDEASRPALRGLQRVDSVAFDLHKWLYLPNDVGCVLVRDADALERGFEMRADYLTRLRGGLTAHPTRFSNRSIELTRRFRALKVWMALKDHGADRFARILGRNLEQARYLAERVEASPELEVAAPVPLNVVNFAYRGGADAEERDALNEELLVRLQESGAAVPSFTKIRGRSVLRVAITNHRSRHEDFDFLVDEVVRLGREIEGEFRAGAQDTKKPEVCDVGRA